jgi:hypothetical protein
MEKEFVPYEQALALKELGFDESTYTWRQHGNGISGDVEGKRDYYNRKGDVYTALPLYQQAFRWFREKYGLYHSIGLDNSLEDDVNCDYQIINHNQSISELETDFKSYEEAELACLNKLIEIVKQQTQQPIKNNKQQTAVEWLSKKTFIPVYLLEQAKEMEKEQINEAFVECWKENMPEGYECKQSAEQYYNETYNN